MNNAPGILSKAEIKEYAAAGSKKPQKEFLFHDHTGRGYFLFKDIRLELFSDGKWCFYISAEGRRGTTILRNGRHCGPELFLVFKDNESKIIKESSLGQVNYDCHPDSVYTYICKGDIAEPAAVADVEVHYNAFMDFACGRLKTGVLEEN